MPINRALATFLLFLTASSISDLCLAQNSKKSRVRPVLPYNHATLNAPPNMVYIRGGSTTIRYNQSSTDTNSIKKVSLKAFFIDKTEVTNQQYRVFTEWVIDSIAVVQYLKDDKYFMSDKKNEKTSESTGTTVATAPADTTGGRTASTDSTVKIGPEFSMLNADSTRKRIDWTKVSHRKIFESNDPEIRSKIAPLLDENGNIRKDKYIFNYTYLRTINTVSTGNPKAKTRKYVSEPVTVYPNEGAWAEDLTNSQTELLVENYFKVPPYDDYPVVGVTWKQARAFAYWRSITATEYTNMPEYMKYYHFTYTLPSEAQWVYAASGYYDMIRSNMDTASVDTTGAAAITAKSDTFVTQHDSTYVAAVIAQSKAKANGSKDQTAAPEVAAEAPIIDSTPVHTDEKGMLTNFKQDEGDYWEDGAALTLPVMAYAPNEFGLYNMEGNVSEWMLDAYSPSTYSFVSDLDPVLQYDADSTDAEAMHRKVVRGGSFISNAKALSPYYRDLELDNVSHCYLGFRCVMSAPEVLYKPVTTRKKRLMGHNTTNQVSRRK
jgi:formylglycine-generating enzyme